MKKLLLLIFCLVAVTLHSSAQKNSLLWEISGNGLEQSSYLFGTIHVLCSEDFEIKEKVKNALSKTKALTVEVDTESEENRALIENLMAPKPNFLNSLSEDKILKISEKLNSINLPAEIFDYVSPVGVISLLTLKSFNCSNPEDITMMEKELQNIMSNDNKTISELETLQFQFDILNSLFTAEEFYQYINKMDEYPALTARMVKAYKEENLEEFNTIMFDNSYLTKENQEILLNTRNENWIKIFPQQMKQNSTFFAVGAGHLIGEKGMIKLLEKEGYTLTPIFN